MAAASVLAIGMDPQVVDLTAFAGITPELVRHYIDAQIEALRALGYEAESCLIDRSETAAEVVRSALGSRRWDCVVIGAGLREPPELLALFETVLNLVLRLAPQAKIAFNTSPADTADAVRRWVVR